MALSSGKNCIAYFGTDHQTLVVNPHWTIGLLLYAFLYKCNS